MSPQPSLSSTLLYRDLCMLPAGLALAEELQCWRKPVGFPRAWFACGVCGRGSMGSRREGRHRGSRAAKCTCMQVKQNIQISAGWFQTFSS